MSLMATGYFPEPVRHVDPVKVLQRWNIPTVSNGGSSEEGLNKCLG